MKLINYSTSFLNLIIFVCIAICTYDHFINFKMKHGFLSKLNFGQLSSENMFKYFHDFSVVVSKNSGTSEVVFLLMQIVTFAFYIFMVYLIRSFVVFVLSRLKIVAAD